MANYNDSFDEECPLTRQEAYEEAKRRGAAWFIYCADMGEQDFVYIHDTEEFALYEKWHIVTRAAPVTDIYSTLIPFEGQKGDIDIWATTQEMRDGTWKKRGWSRV